MSIKKMAWLIPVVLFSACGSSTDGGYTRKEATSAAEFVNAADSTAISAAAAPLNAKDRKVIHTADFRCKVTDVFDATTRLENLVKSLGGVVQESHMDNSGYDTRTTYYKPDSLRQTQTYTTTSTLTLRVPTAGLDSVIKEVPGLAAFIDSRTLRQSDVTYRYLENELKNQVGNTQKTSDKALSLAKKSHEPLMVQEYDQTKEEQKIGRKIENLSMMDDINYATLTVAFSQPERVFVQTIVNPQYLTRPSFTLQAKAALANGWQVICGFTIMLINVWPLVLLIPIVWILARKIRRKRIVFAHD